MSINAGFGKAEITCFLPGIGMMGYGQVHNTVEEVATPLWSRAMILQDETGSFFFQTHLELAFISIAIKSEVLKVLNEKHPSWDLTAENFLLTAQHTHSAPGGFSHYPFYNFTIPGFRPEVMRTITEGVVHSLENAYKELAPTKISWGIWNISPDKEVAFNRSIKAYKNNPEAEDEENHLAINRTMEGVAFRDMKGKLRAVFNVFGVHCTSISSFNHRIHHDNKGVAAELFEKHHPETIAFFVQGAAGDVSPNFIWDKQLNRMRGKFKDQYESAEFNGEIQFRESEKVSEEKVIHGKIQCSLTLQDMSQLVGPPAHGLAFFEGTQEGPGIPKALAMPLGVLSDVVKKLKFKDRSFNQAQHPKKVILDHRSGAFIGIPHSLWKSLPLMPGPIASFQREAKRGALETLPWVPTVLPFQLIKIGPLLIVAVPGEITTISAKRLKDELERKCLGQGVEVITLISYANAYMGYITTPEEYMIQCYEGGHTVYGRETLRGIIDGFCSSLSKLKGEDYSSVEKMFEFPESELALRSL